MDAGSLAAFRVFFGAAMVFAVTRYFAHGWIGAQFEVPRYFFTYRGLDWIRPWPHPWMHVHFAVLGALALAIALGYRARLATALFGLGFTWVHLIDKTNYLNHYYLVSLLCLWMALLPLEAGWSVDAKLRPTLARRTVPRWTVDVLRFQVGLVYFFAGVAKLEPDWLVRGQPLRIWLTAAASVPAVGPWLASKPVALGASWAAALFDLATPFLLLFRRTRAWAYAAVVVFHAVTSWLFPIGLFPWLMTSLALIFLDPAWPSRLVATLWRGAAPAPDAAVSAIGIPHRRVRWHEPVFRFGVAVLVAAQLTIPLRHWLRPGNVLWTEDGFRFAWMVMLMEKVGTATFHVREPSTGRARAFDPAELLTPVQTRLMATQPDMIAQLAWEIRDRMVTEGWRDPEVRADVQVSLNGRPSRTFVNPDVDLASAAVRRVGRAPVVPFIE